MKEQIKEILKKFAGDNIAISEKDFDELSVEISEELSLAPSVTDEEIKRDIKREAELYQSDPAKTSFEISRAEYFAFCEGAKWMRDNHLPSKGDEKIDFDNIPSWLVELYQRNSELATEAERWLRKVTTPQKSDDLVELRKHLLSFAFEHVFDDTHTIETMVDDYLAEQALKEKGTK